MTAETPTRSDVSPNSDAVEPRDDTQWTDENAEPESLLPRQMQEPVLWPRVFPGLGVASRLCRSFRKWPVAAKTPDLMTDRNAASIRRILHVQVGARAPWASLGTRAGADSGINLPVASGCGARETPGSKSPAS